MTGCILKHVVIPEDTHFLYEMMMSDDQYLYSTKLQFHTEREFECWLIDRLSFDFHDFFLVEDSDSLEYLGYVHNYDFSLIDGHCKLVVCMLPEYRETGIGAVAAVTFMKKLFYQYPLRKIYSTIYDYNEESLRSNLNAGFQEEGVVKDYRYYNGVFHSIHYLSMTREKFDSTIGRMVEVCSV